VVLTPHTVVLIKVEWKVDLQEHGDLASLALFCVFRVLTPRMLYLLEHLISVLSGDTLLSITSPSDPIILPDVYAASFLVAVQNEAW
jgi:hypothetical protein